MAIIDLQTNAQGAAGAVFLWETVTGDDTGEPLQLNGMAGLAVCVQMTGTFGAAVTMQGSVDGTNWATLKTVDGSDAELTAAGLLEIATGARYIRPSAASGVSDVDVYLASRRG